MQQRACPACGSNQFGTVVGEAAVRHEIDLRDDFVYSRIGHKASPTELKDLTDFMHGFPAPLAACGRCGTVIRQEERPRSADHYEEDPNDPALMAQVYPRYVEAFGNKEVAYRDLLAPHSDVLEIGSHLGAFLETAESWDWRPLGLDVGLDTSAFARRMGLAVRREILEDSRLPDASYDGIFIWNCFEQIDEPRPTLLRAWRLLNRFGLLVIRVPNALFYRMRSGSEDAFGALAYNNLLGFPYLYGYTAESLNRLVESCGFKYVRGFNSELVTMPFADLTRRVADEQREVRDTVAGWSTATTMATGTLTGPWIELVYRKQDEPAARRRRTIPRRRIDLRFLERAA